MFNLKPGFNLLPYSETFSMTIIDVRCHVSKWTFVNSPFLSVIKNPLVLIWILTDLYNLITYGVEYT